MTAPPRIRQGSLRKATPTFLAVLLVMVMAGAAILTATWECAVLATRNEALRLAQAAATGIPHSALMKLSADASDLNRLEYLEIKRGLASLVAQQDAIRFAYIYVERNGRIYFLVDSEPPGSADYSPPGQEYWEADAETWQPLVLGEPLVSQPTADRWGEWVSALVPIKDSLSGKTVAVFGLDYPADAWHDQAVTQTIHAGVVLACAITIFMALYAAFTQNRRLQEEKRKLLALDSRLRESETLFRAIFDQSPVGIAIGHENSYMQIKTNLKQDFNPMYEKIVGRSRSELEKIGWADITHPDDLPLDLDHFFRMRRGEIDSYDMEKRYVKPDGSLVWAHMYIVPLRLPDNGGTSHLCIIEDISKRKEMEKALVDSERSKAVLLDNLPGMAYRRVYDRHCTMSFVSPGCYELTGYPAEHLLNNQLLCFDDLIAPEHRDTLWMEWERVLAQQLPFRHEYAIVSASGEMKWVLEMGQGVFDESGRVEALEGIIIDVSKQKQREAQIEYMNGHDYLTDLRNRRYFEGAMVATDQNGCTPTSIIVADINGVRLINEAFGYTEGDALVREVARILQDSCRPGDVVARMGGDEFAVLLPHACSKTVQQIVRKINGSCALLNDKGKNRLYEVSLAIGSATKELAEDTLSETLRLAGENMRNRKLFNRKSVHSDIISSMMATVYEKSQETEGHSKRLAALSRRVGASLNLPHKSLDELELLAMLHDIGKVAIDDRVLNKPGKLDANEWAIMKKHPEIGYRIAKSSSQLEPIAEYILAHHERWDGTGYPRQLAGEDIPLISRIIAVVDAYDAMTEDRVYRKALGKDQAIEEIRRNAGTQFDPGIVGIFIDELRSE